MVTLLPGSFKGVPILVKGGTDERGRRLLPYEFPNSERRIIQDLGFDQPIYDLEIIVTGGTPEEYESNRDGLIRVLTEPGQGILIHPFYGELNVRAGKFTVSQDISTYLKAKFTCKFYEVRETRRFIENLRTPEFIELEIENTIPVILSSYSAQYPSARTSNIGFQNLVDLTVEFINNILIWVSALNAVVDVEPFTDKYRQTISANVNSGSSLTENTQTLIQDIDVQFDDPEDAIEFYPNLVNFSRDAGNVNLNRFIEAQKQQVTLDLFNTLGFYYYVLAVLRRQYTLRSEVLTDIEFLTETYDRLITQENNTVARYVSDTYFLAINYLTELLDTVYQEVEVTSLPVFSVIPTIYSIYGDLDNIDIIYDNNDFGDASIRDTGELTYFSEPLSDVDS